jgi:hypothetical protein
LIRTLLEYYRIPEDVLGEIFRANVSNGPGFFHLGPDILCYGSCSAGVASNAEAARSYDALNHITIDHSELRLPFDADQVIENMRREHYAASMISWRESLFSSKRARSVYYIARDLLPTGFRRQLQRAYFGGWDRKGFPHWPVDFSVDGIHQTLLRLAMEARAVRKIPFIWFWPDGFQSCLVMTHDVETRLGRDFTSQLMDLDDSHGFKASFQVVPEKRYEVPDAYIQEIRGRGFEFNIHDLNHDGNLYRNRDEFFRRAAKINAYARQYAASGFRAGALYRNPEWFDAFEFSYDMSIPNVAHLEPQRGGCCTIMPFFIGRILELPLTTAEDYSLFHVLNDFSIDLWKQQFELITSRHGMASFITHPDYLIELRARKTYETLLGYLSERAAADKVWKALPGEVDCWWRARSKMELVSRGGDWQIQGPQKERAQVAFAVLDGHHLKYEFAGNSVAKEEPS